MTREEAIEVYNGLINTKIKEAFEFFAPELAGSEDERIRKEIKDIVLSYRSNCVYEGSHHFDECLAWLEKQKEQKPAEVDERMKNDKHFLSICQHLETLISESKKNEDKESMDKDYRWLCEFYRKSRFVEE